MTYSSSTDAVFDDSGKIVALAVADTKEQAAARAKCIATALNSHDELLTALRDILPLCTDSRCIKSVRWTTARDAARAAIAKAEAAQ